ncbi:MAG: PEP-CTERM sorting domain-containing protein [Aeromonadaceae bacterium]|nr:PEP-CTERM sorting domain-containing protein [Aeromonadaceae bacterium]
MLKKILLGLLLTMGVARADVLYLDNGFVASTTEGALIGGGNYFADGLFAADSEYVNSLVKLSNLNGLFSFNSFEANSFYEFDAVNVAVYGASGLIQSYSMRQVWSWPSMSWSLDTDLLPGTLFTGVSYMTIQSAYSLGFEATLPTLTAAVPEPSQWALLLLGAGALLGLSRRRRGMGMALPA